MSLLLLEMRCYNGKRNESIIDRVFKKEIGMDINKAVGILDRGGITPEDLGDITNKLKRMITDEVEIREVFHKKFVKALDETEKTEEIDEKRWYDKVNIYGSYL